MDRDAAWANSALRYQFKNPDLAVARLKGLEMTQYFLSAMRWCAPSRVAS